jgi:alkylhydroperoxidase family enzyme
MPDGQSTVLGQGHRPRMASAAVAMSQAVYQESRLGLREAEAARIRIAHINGCLLCKNFRVADDLGELMSRLNAADQVANVQDRGERPSNAFYEAILAWRESDLFSERERRVRRARRRRCGPADPRPGRGSPPGWRRRRPSSG